MIYIKYIGKRKNKNGTPSSWAWFFCEPCEKYVEKRYDVGKKAKSCGCATKKILSILNTGDRNPFYGKKHTKESKQKNRENHLGKLSSEETKQKIREKSNNFYMNGGEVWNKGLTKETDLRVKNQSDSLKNNGKVKGENNPFHGKKHTEESNLKISIANKGRMLGINNPMYGKTGSLCPNWNNGSSFGPYGIEFNKELKQQVLERDNYVCQCPDCGGNHNILDTHHIDYDKKNNNPENLIILCRSCHMKTNFNRKYHTEFYQNIIMGKMMECLL